MGQPWSEATEGGASRVLTRSSDALVCEGSETAERMPLTGIVLAASAGWKTLADSSRNLDKTCADLKHSPGGCNSLCSRVLYLLYPGDDAM